MPKPPDGLAERDRVPDLTRPEAEATARDALLQRQRRLAPGHPSSPTWDDGPRDDADHAAALAGRPEAEPVPDAGRVLSPREIKDRLRQARADGLASEEQYTLDARNEVWSEEREALHDGLIEDLYSQAAGVPDERRAIIAGGLPGAGKTTVLEGRAGIDRSQFLTVNPDDIKDEMAKRGMIPHVAGLSPMEASDLVHEESSHIAKRLARRAQGDGKNMIWDITMSSLDSTRARIQALRNHGYAHIEAIFVDIPPDVSAARAAARHGDGQARYQAGEGYGGRFVSDEGILASADPVWGSANRRTLELIKPDVDAWTIYDNSVDGRPAVLRDSSVPRERNT